MRRKIGGQAGGVAATLGPCVRFTRPLARRKNGPNVCRAPERVPAPRRRSALTGNPRKPAQTRANPRAIRINRRAAAPRRMDYWGERAAGLKGEKLICAIHEYAWEVYGDAIRENRDRCPYNLDFGDRICERRQLVAWFAAKWTNPDTGATVVDEFVEAYVRDGGTASRILRLKDAVYDEFDVFRGGNRFRAVRAASDGSVYKVMDTGFASDIVRNCRRFEGAIFPWYPSGTHRTYGVLTIRAAHPRWSRCPVRNFESAHQEDQDHVILIDRARVAESFPLTPRFRLRAALKKFPGEWISQAYAALELPDGDHTRGTKADAISDALASASLLRVLDGLSAEERECLAAVGSRAWYSDVRERFGPEEADVRWSKFRPKSVIGRLRRRCLLLAGSAPDGGRRRKALAVAPDVLANLERLGFRADG